MFAFGRLKKNLPLELSFTQKVGGVAASFLVFFGCVSSFSLFDAYEIRREIEETSLSDIPLLQTVIALEQQSKRFQNKVELLEHYQVHSSDISYQKEIDQLSSRLIDVCHRIESLIDRGLEQAEFAIADEQLKEGDIRLNQLRESYEYVSTLFYQLKQSHRTIRTLAEATVFDRNQYEHDHDHAYSHEGPHDHGDFHSHEDILSRNRTLVRPKGGFVRSQNILEQMFVQLNINIESLLNEGLDHDHHAHEPGVSGETDFYSIYRILDDEFIQEREILDKMTTQLNMHMQSSLAIAMREQERLQMFHLSVSSTAIVLGVTLVLSLMTKLSNSLAQVTRRAKSIASNLANDEALNLETGLEQQELETAIAAGKEVADLSFAFNQMVENVARSRHAQELSEKRLAEEKQMISLTLDSIGDGVLTTNNEGRVVSANPSAESLLGSPLLELQGQSLVQIFEQHGLINRDIFNIEASKECQRISMQNCHGKSKVFDMSQAPILSEDNRILGSVIVFRDMTQMLETTRQLSWQATHDPLTGLANRRQFQSTLEEIKSLECLDKAKQHCILYLDLDRFKIVNDTCGHDAGDRLLSQIAHHISHEVRSSDLVARLGGDEFGIILKNCSLDQATTAGNKILSAVEQFRFIWQDRQFSLGISIGAVKFSPAQDDPTMILKAADTACYHAKHAGRNQLYVVQDPRLHLENQTLEMNWLAVINRALEKNMFQLYQQKIASVDADIPHEHYEILLRLRTDDGGILSPGAFLPIAERYQLMAKIDRWVISNFFAAAKGFLRSLKQQQSEDSGVQRFYSLNLSSESLNDPTLIPFLEEQFALHQIPPQLICFEITETMAIANLHRARQIIQDIRDLGCRFALDDFGSGMSSFGYLKTLPVDYLKIDGQFIRDLCQNTMNEIIVKALHQVAEAAHIKTIAEFVQDEDCLQKLQDIGIDYAQGYGIEKPKPFHQEWSLNSPMSSKKLYPSAIATR